MKYNYRKFNYYLIGLYSKYRYIDEENIIGIDYKIKYNNVN